MLNEYCTENSEYLKDDAVNKKRALNDKQRIQYHGNIQNHFIPFLQERKISSIQGITNSVYSQLKIHLQEKLKKEKTINNVLIPINRILQYHERNELIVKLPYGKGLGSVLTNENNETERYPLPVEYIGNLFPLDTNNFVPGRDNEKLYYYLLGMIGLTTGMRNSEIARIQKQDIYRIKDTEIFILKVYNNKTEYYHQNKTDQYRKIPLHPFVVKLLKFYITEKEKEATIFPTSFLFGKPVFKDGKIIDGILYNYTFDRAIKELYERILIKQKYAKTGKGLEAFIIDDTELEYEMKKNHITFYSLRHTFITICATYKGLDVDNTDDIINYFTGHKIDSAMRARYTHINKIEDNIFYDNYGVFVFNVLTKFIFFSDEERQTIKQQRLEKIREVMNQNEHLFKDGRITDDEFHEKIIKPLLNKEVKEEIETDDVFETI
jgi:integrase